MTDYQAGFAAGKRDAAIHLMDVARILAMHKLSHVGDSQASEAIQIVIDGLHDLAAEVESRP